MVEKQIIDGETRYGVTIDGIDVEELHRQYRSLLKVLDDNTWRQGKPISGRDMEVYSHLESIISLIEVILFDNVGREYPNALLPMKGDE